MRAPKIELGDFDGLRCVRAASDLAVGELIASIRFSSAFHPAELPLPDTIDATTRLAAAILLERLSDAPRRAAHLGALPSAFPMLCGRMTADVQAQMSPQMRAMADAHLRRDVDARAALRRACEAVESAASAGDSATGAERSDADREDLRRLRRALDDDGQARLLEWALDVVTTPVPTPTKILTPSP